MLSRISTLQLKEGELSAKGESWEIESGTLPGGYPYQKGRTNDLSEGLR